jgi:hypothetical protein
MNNVLKQPIKAIVKELFSDGKSPLAHYGIDADKIERMEMAHPGIAKHTPLSKRVR